MKHIKAFIATMMAVTTMTVSVLTPAAADHEIKLDGHIIRELIPEIFETLADDDNMYDPVWENQNDQVTGRKEARIYQNRLDQYQTINVAEVKGYEDVPFVSVHEYLEFLYGKNIACFLDRENNVFKINRGGVTARLDLNSMELQCDNWDWFFGGEANGGAPEGCFVTNIELNAISYSSKHEWTATKTKQYSISLNADGIGAVVLDRDVLLPFCILQNIFALSNCDSDYYLTYNGDDFYAIPDTLRNAESGSRTTPYAKALYSGRFSNQEEPTQAYAKYNYASICLLLDLRYGHKEEIGMKDADSFFTEKGIKDRLLSRDIETYTSTLCELLLRTFDSGHDAITLEKSVFKSAAEESEEQDEAIDEMMDEDNELIRLIEMFVAVSGLVLGPDTSKNLADSLTVESYMTEEYKDGPRIDMEGDTAFIYFEEFQENLERESFYISLPKEEDYKNSTFALFYNAFEKIKENKDIKKVVIDLSHNGGGSATALVTTLGFLSPDGEAHVSYKNTKDGSFREEYYHVDTNLDGKFDDSDGYGGRYDFYILTSPCSYSSGNALPFFAQQNGLARVIGEEPGGGDCVVDLFYDAYGLAGYFSGAYKLGTIRDNTFISNENQVEMDLPFDGQEGYKARSLYFNRSAIADFISES